MNHPIELNLESARSIEPADEDAAGRYSRPSGNRRGRLCSLLWCEFTDHAGRGAGTGRAVSAGEFGHLVEFYFSPDEPVRVETCPLAHASLFEHFGQRGYGVTEFSNVMARRVGNQEAGSVRNGIEVCRASREETNLWTLTVARGFTGNFPVTEEILRVMKMFALAKNTECYLAWIGGCVVGGATLAVRGRIVGLFGASTLPEFRKRGYNRRRRRGVSWR